MAERTATFTRSFAAATWLLAKGFELERIEKAFDGSGALVYRFPLEAQADMQEFYVQKARLNTLSVEAREK